MVVLNQLSSEYREVSRELAKEKQQKKMELQASDSFVYSRLISLVLYNVDVGYCCGVAFICTSEFVFVQCSCSKRKRA